MDKNYMRKILVVEDDVQLSEAYKIVFQSNGYKVVMARDGEEGLSLALAEEPDLILLDMLMPKMHGIEFLRAYDVKHKHPKTRIIAFSNMRSDDLEKQAKDLGAERYEVKANFTPTQLANMVLETLESRP
jgi:DNA-binding response OmpR family regulator